MHNILKILTLASAMLISANANAISTIQLNEALFADANAAYDSRDYQQAADSYNQILDAGFASWELYYNLGNAYYRLDQIGLAIINYERALRLAPIKQIIKDNLELARSKTTDNIEQLPKLFLVQWMENISRITSPRGWRVLLLAALILTAATACIFFIAKDYRTRRTLFIIGGILLIVTIFFAFNTAFSAKSVTNNKEAVVIDPMIVVKGSPDAKSVDKFIIHEGTTFTISDRQDKWWQITLADGKSGWINSGAEII
jgi:hypothetical protein